MMMKMQSLRVRAFLSSPPRTDPCRGNRGRVPSPLRSISIVHRPRLPVACSGGFGKKEVVAAAVTKHFGGKAVGDRHSEMEPSGQEQDPRIARISSSIRVIPDFPKPGIMFQDITTMLLDPKAFKDTIDLFIERYKDKNISVVAGIEARGFIFGPPIALAIGAKFIPMRKPGKLPGEVISEEYSLEYGTDKMEMHVGAVEEGERALVVDDLIATGGTLGAAIRLLVCPMTRDAEVDQGLVARALERVGVTVVECACLVELSGLKGREKLGDKPLFVLVSSA